MQQSIDGLSTFFQGSLLAVVLVLPASGTPQDLGAEDWSGIRQAYDAGRLAIHPVEGGHRARNPGQRWHTLFDGRGFTATPDDGSWTWGLELRSYGFAGHEMEVTGAESVRVEGQRITYTWDDCLDEWYVNDRRGLEHGYTVHRRPAAPEGASSGMLAVHLAVRADLTPEVVARGASLRFVDVRGATVLTYSGLKAFDAVGRGLPARMEVTDDVVRILVDDRTASYPLTIDPIAQQAYLKPSNTESGDSFGGAVAVSGDTVVVAASSEDSGATGVNGDQNDNSVGSAGAVYVFVRSGGTWVQQAYLKASNPGLLDSFGQAVAISGDTVVVGAGLEDSSATGVNGDQADNSASNSGAAYVFVRSGSTWTQQAYLKASNTDPDDGFGRGVSISGDTIAVAAPFESSNATGVNGSQADNSAPFAGAVYVFQRTGTVWAQQAYLKASSTDAFDNFGFSVGISGNTVAVGAPFEDSDATGVGGDPSNNQSEESGAVYVFTRSGETWSQQEYLKASNADPNDELGRATAISDDTVLVSAIREDSAATGVNGDETDNSRFASGAAYVFVRNGTVWTQQAYLKASNAGEDDFFGESVALWGDSAVVGTSSEDSASIGVNGDQASNAAGASGAAYLFTRSGTDWSQQAYLKASNTDFADFFGEAVAVSDQVVVAGARGEDSAAIGVNGDQADDSSGHSGAAYLFDLEAAIGPYCAQGKPTSVFLCYADLLVSGPSLSSDSWTIRNVPLGPTTTDTIGIFLYTSGVGTGASPFQMTTPFGMLCLTDFARSSPACAPVSLSGPPGTCGNVFPPFSPDCGGGALGIQPGHDVNVQGWYRDPDVVSGANFTSAAYYTATP